MGNLNCNNSVKIYWSNPTPKMYGVYTGQVIPPSYDINTNSYGSNGYIYGDVVMFRPGFKAPTRSIYLNGGNSLANVNFNNVLQNYEDSSYFDECNNVHDFSNSTTLPIYQLEWSVETMNGGRGQFTVHSKDNPVIEEEINRLMEMVEVDGKMVRKYRHGRYFIVEMTAPNGSQIRTFATITNYRLIEASSHVEAVFEMFDLADFYGKATLQEGQSQKDVSSGDISKENTPLAAIHMKPNIFADVEEIQRYVAENGGQFNQNGLSDFQVRKVLEKICDDYLTQGDNRQWNMINYGVFFAELQEFNSRNLKTRAIEPFIPKGSAELLKAYRMRGTARQTFANYCLHHMRESHSFNIAEATAGTGRFDQRYPDEVRFCDSGVKYAGIGLFGIDPKNLPNFNNGFKYFTTKATEFGTGMDELLSTFGIERVNWSLELREYDGLTRAILVPNLDVDFLEKNQSEITNVEFSINRNETIDDVVAYRYNYQESDGNSEYHDAVPDSEKNGPNDKLFYDNIGALPNSSNIAHETGFATAHANKLDAATNEKFDTKTSDLEARIKKIEDTCCNDNPPPPPPPPPVEGEWYHPYGKNVSITQEYECAFWNGAPYPSCPSLGNCAHFHNGMDFSAGYGAALYAAQDGQILRAGDIGDGFGNTVLLLIPGLEGLNTIIRYSHLSSMDVSVNQNVVKGQKIGAEGNTGFSTGSHLHLGVYPSTGSSSASNADNYCSAENPRQYPFSGFGSGTRLQSVLKSTPTPTQIIADNVEEAPVVKTTPNLKALITTSADNMPGYLGTWNNSSYAVQNVSDRLGTFVEGIPRRLSIETSDKTRKEAQDRIKNLPRVSELKIKFDIIDHKGNYPLFDIKPGDTIYVNILLCGKEYDVEKLVKSARISFDGKKWTYTLDYE